MGQQFIQLHKKKDRQCTYDAMLRGSRLTIVAMQKHKVLHILSVCL